MIDYKRIIKSHKTRAKILQMLRVVPDEKMLKAQYWIKLGRRLNLENPQRFTEKLQWYKLNYRNPVMKQCVNKYAVRDFVKAKGLENTLVKLYAHYDKTENIEWEKLPESFVVKTQHGSGGLNVIIVSDKKMFSKEMLVSKLSFKEDAVSKKDSGREWAYWNIPAGVVVEELLVNKENPEAGVNDYKIFCYGGKPKYIIVDVDRYIGHKRNFYDTNWQNLHITSDCPASDREIPRPENLNEMLRIAEILSEEFPYVRVDLYNVDGKIYFGELTFYPWSGYVQFLPDEADYLFGEDFELVRQLS